MRDYIDLDCTPTYEDCAQVGTPDYYTRARRECRAYIGQLRRCFGPEPEGARLRLQANPHDFGDYFSVVCEYDAEQFPASAEYALRCEAESPAYWDEEARQELAVPAAGGGAGTRSQRSIVRNGGKAPTILPAGGSDRPLALVALGDIVRLREPYSLGEHRAQRGPFGFGIVAEIVMCLADLRPRNVSLYLYDPERREILLGANGIPEFVDFHCSEFDLYKRASEAGYQPLV